MNVLDVGENSERVVDKDGCLKGDKPREISDTSDMRDHSEQSTFLPSQDNSEVSDADGEVTALEVRVETRGPPSPARATEYPTSMPTTLTILPPSPHSSVIEPQAPNQPEPLGVTILGSQPADIAYSVVPDLAEDALNTVSSHLAPLNATIPAMQEAITHSRSRSPQPPFKV